MKGFKDFERYQVSFVTVFGLCDDEDNNEVTIDSYHDEPAYLCEDSTHEELLWIAKITNSEEKEVIFVPIDKCGLVPKREDGKDSKQCDGMFSYEEVIAFIELKNRGGKKPSKWINNGIEQLMATIAHFDKYDFIQNKKIKRAYISNKKRPISNVSNAERSERFTDDTGYVLYIGRDIDVE